MEFGNRKSVFVAFLCVVLLAMTVFAGPAAAQAGGGRNAIITQLNPAIVQGFRAWLRNQADEGTPPPPIDFKVPAEITTQIVCRMSSSGLRCIPDVSTMRCPSAVDIEIPGGGRTTVPVSCTGPDNDGNCECDFVER
jgi:hypothetical protein